MAQRMQACVVCHGKEGRATNQGYFPRIAGKPAGYLYNQLLNFKEGRRQYPMMTYMVEQLPDAYLREIAQYFADLHPPYPPPAPNSATPAMIERGRKIVHEGDQANRVPACIACHGEKLTGVAPSIPACLAFHETTSMRNSAPGATRCARRMRRTAWPMSPIA